MDAERDARDLQEAIRHAGAGLKALDAAHQGSTAGGKIYPVHIHLAAVELAHAIEVAMKVALRNQ